MQTKNLRRDEKLNDILNKQSITELLYGSISYYPLNGNNYLRGFIYDLKCRLWNNDEPLAIHVHLGK